MNCRMHDVLGGSASITRRSNGVSPLVCLIVTVVREGYGLVLVASQRTVRVTSCMSRKAVS